MLYDDGATQSVFYLYRVLALRLCDGDDDDDIGLPDRARRPSLSAVASRVRASRVLHDGALIHTYIYLTLMNNNMAKYYSSTYSSSIDSVNCR